MHRKNLVGVVNFKTASF
jgi:hypothetical protein